MTTYAFRVIFGKIHQSQLSMSILIQTVGAVGRGNSAVLLRGYGSAEFKVAYVEDFALFDSVYCMYFVIRVIGYLCVYLAAVTKE